MSRHPDRKAVEFIAHRLKLGTPRQRIIALVCGGYQMEWEQAEALLSDVEIERDLTLRSTPAVYLMTILGAGLAGAFLFSFYVWGTSTVGSSVSLLWVGVVFIVGAGAFLLVVSAYSRYQNLTKEQYRCRACGHLANRLGQQEPIFLPRYKAATYQTRQKRLSTRHDSWEDKGWPQWDTYAVFEVTEVCRRCGEIRKKQEIERKMGGYRGTDQDDYDYW